MNAPSTNPTSLRVVAGLFIFSGICTAVEIAVSLTRGHINLNLGILCIWIGFGLLRHNRTWRTWALVFLWFGMIALPAFSLMALSRSMLDFKLFGVPVGEVPSALAVFFVVPLFMLTVWEYRVLTRPGIKSLF